MYNNEIINFVSGRQYKSISYIEKLNKESILKDLDYEYSLNMQTKDKLSNAVNIFMNNEELHEIVINPIHEIITRKNVINLQPIVKQFKNIISYKVVPYYALSNLLPSGYLLDAIKLHGCVEYLNIKYTLEDKRFIKIEASIKYRWCLFKHKPRQLQPNIIILSLDEAKELIMLLEAAS